MKYEAVLGSFGLLVRFTQVETIQEDRIVSVLEAGGRRERQRTSGSPMPLVPSACSKKTGEISLGTRLGKQAPGEISLGTRLGKQAPGEISLGTRLGKQGYFTYSLMTNGRAEYLIIVSWASLHVSGYIYFLYPKGV